MSSHRNQVNYAIFCCTCVTFVTLTAVCKGFSIWYPHPFKTSVDVIFCKRVTYICLFDSFILIQSFPSFIWLIHSFIPVIHFVSFILCIIHSHHSFWTIYSYHSFSFISGFARVGGGAANRGHGFSPAPPDLTFDHRGSSPLEGLHSVAPPPLPPPPPSASAMKKVNPKENPLVRGLIGKSAFDANNGNNLVKAKQWTHRELVTTVLKVGLLFQGVLLVKMKSAFPPVKRVYSVNTYSWISIVPRGSERSEWDSLWMEQVSEVSGALWSEWAVQANERSERPSGPLEARLSGRWDCSFIPRHHHIEAGIVISPWNDFQFERYYESLIHHYTTHKWLIFLPHCFIASNQNHLKQQYMEEIGKRLAFEQLFSVLLLSTNPCLWFQDVTITVEWLKDRGLMVGARTCPRCGPLVRLELSRAPRTRHWQSYDQLVWLCHNCDNSTYLRQVRWLAVW